MPAARSQIALSLGLLLAACGSAHAVVTQQVVAYRGQPVPLLTDVFFGVFTNNTAPYFSDADTIGITSTMTGAGTASTNNRGLFLGDPAAPPLVAREGSDGIGEPSTFLALSNSGLLAFQAPLLGAPTSTDGALFTRPGAAGPTTQRAREGDPAPDQPVGVTYGTLTTVPRVNLLDDLLFNVTLSGTGITATNDVALYGGAPASPRLIVQENQPAPVTGPGISDVRFSNVNTTFQSNSQGKVLFFSFFIGTGIGGSANTGLFLATPTGAVAPNPAYTTSLIARQGDQAPGLASGITYTTDFAPSIARTIDRFANLAFSVSVAGTGITTANNGVLFAGSADTASSITSLYQEGDLITATDISGDVRWSAFDSFTFDGSGASAADSRLFIRAGLIGTDVASTNNSAIFVRDGAAALALVVREDQDVPGLTGIKFGDITSLATNTSGTIAFNAGLTGLDVGTTTNSALFLKRFGEAAVLLLREGDAITVAPGDTRLVATISFRGGNAGQDGSNTGLNESDSVAVRVTFTDNTDAVLVLSDEPAVTPCPLNFDDTGASQGVIDLADLNAFFDAWGQANGSPCPPLPAPCPLNFDDAGASQGVIDLADLNAFFDAWGQANGTACP